MGVRFDDDDVEPWRAGGDNSNAGKPVIRYGPRPNQEREYQIRKAEGMHYEKKYFLENNVELFNDPEQPLVKRQEAIQKILCRVRLLFPKLGKLYTDEAVKDYFFRKSLRQGDAEFPQHLYRISEGQLAMKEILPDQTYRTMQVFPLGKLRLELRGLGEKNWKKSELTVHVILPDDERMPSFRKTFLGW